VNQRRDAQRNRARIIAAAAEVFRESGAGAPLDLVAHRAGVGRGTLYRHFPDRGALIAAVLEMRMEALEQYAATYPGDDLVEHLLVAICRLQLDAPGLFTAVRATAGPQATLEAVAAHAQALLSGALDRAQRAHTVRDDVFLTDVLLAIAMFDGVISVQSEIPGDDVVERALTIVLRGLRSRERSDLPVPVPTLRLPTA